MNEAVRGDEKIWAGPAAGLTRALNQLCVTCGRAAQAYMYPPNNECFRGDQYRQFFFPPGRVFVSPAGVLAHLVLAGDG